MSHTVIGLPIRFNLEQARESLESRLDQLARVAERAEQYCAGDTFELAVLVAPDGPYDQRETLERRCRHVLEKWEGSHPRSWPAEVLFDRLAVKGEPATLMLNRLHDFCFGELKAEHLVCIEPAVSSPSFPDESLQEDIEDGLIGLAAEQEADLVLGDYEPVIWPGNTKQEHIDIKIRIESSVKQLLGFQFGRLIGECQVFSLQRRVRTEFYQLSRRLYEQLLNYEPIPYDYGLQMLLTVRQHGLELKRVEIGKVPEKSSKYDTGTTLEQLQRVQFQIDRLAVIFG